MARAIAGRGVSPGSGRRRARRTWPSSARGAPSGHGRAASGCEMPISAPKPNSSPSTKRVEALTSTAAASTSSRKRSACAEVAGDDRLAVAGAVAVMCAIASSSESTTRRRASGRGTRWRSPRRSPRRSRGRTARARSSPTSSTLGECGVDPGEERRGDVGVHHERLGGVAHRRPLRLGVDDDPLGHRRGRRRRRRRRGSCRRRRSRTGTVACSRIDAISDGPPRGIRQSIEPRCCMNSTAASREVSSTSTSASSGRPAFTQRLAQHRRDGDVRGDAPRRAAQERRVAGLQAQRRRRRRSRSVGSRR